jgi:transposase-like protein
MSFRNYLELVRWNDGVTCPKCLGKRISSILKRDQYNCDNESCTYQFSVTAGTIFHDTHLPLTKWLLAVFIMCQSRKGVSANQLKRMLGINYRTAWYLCHRIRHAVEQATTPKLDGTVEVDETYVGGKKIGWGVYAGKKEKEVVIGIRQRNKGKGAGELQFFRAEDTKSGTLAKYIKENVSSDVDVIVTDEFSAYPWALDRAGMPRGKHQTVNHGQKEYVRLGTDIHTNTVESAFSLLKRGIIGTWHRVSAKHLSACLDEMTWRFNNHKNPYLFRDTMLRLIHFENLEYKQLTAA